MADEQSNIFMPKFRVWDIKQKKMSKPFTFADLYGYEGEDNAVLLYHPYKTYIGAGQDFVLNKHKGGSGGSAAFPQRRVIEGWNPNLILMQYCDFTDFLDELICRNDILSDLDGKEQIVVDDELIAKWILSDPPKPKRDFIIIGDTYRGIISTIKRIKIRGEG